MEKIYLILEDGHIFEGKSFGALGESIGELVFTTGMGGYIETLTDPSYYGQIIMQTFPLIGNYGMIAEDVESSAPACRGYVVREWCATPSNFRCEENIDKYLKDNNIVGIYGVDTREITKLIREKGVMNAIISKTPNTDLFTVKEYYIKDAVKNVSTTKSEFFKATAKSLYSVALIDYGSKRNIVRELNKRGCDVTVLPNSISAKQVLDGGYDGIMLSNGPGDPAENTSEINELSKLMGKLPIFGICLGHQLLALANGAKTEKLKYGHRGVNQPVKDTDSGRTYITSQNHGYAVVSDSVPNGAKIRYINANDGTCEGIDYIGENAFSVQFHPEACSGPLDTRFMFERFTDMMGGKKNAD